MVFEAEGVGKSFGDRCVVRNVSIRVVRGDRIGLIGPNGAGKTTLLRLLLGELAPDVGTVRVGASVQVAYFDQQREPLDPERSVVDTVGDGNDQVTVGGRTRHVHGYLEDFLFSPERARSPVKALSGGERNRLLLARLLTRPANVLVLDEPTNDLDIETLQLLEARLTEWSGTLLVVSHDRRFLDHIVTSTLAFEGEGRVMEYVGGYADWLRQQPSAPSQMQAAPPKAEPQRQASAPAVSALSLPRKATFNERRELEDLPGRIERLEEEQRRLAADVESVDFYKRPAEEIRTTMTRLEVLPEELLAAYARWDELDSLR
jgi:ATP-binding cassette subfamily F protein uup